MCDSKRAHSSCSGPEGRFTLNKAVPLTGTLSKLSVPGLN